MRRSNGKRLANDLASTLRIARSAPVRDAGASVATQIAKGQLTRERCCEGKARFTTYDYAERVGRENGPELRKTFRAYACPFCCGYHLRPRSCGNREQLAMKTRVAYLEMSAEFSEGRTLRYWLERAWSLTNPRRLVVIGLNPSTADDTVDDPTIRRCVSFAKREVCGGLIMVNLFGYRATSPRDLIAATNPGAGHIADQYLLTACAAPDRLVVAAWGTHGTHRGRGVLVRSLLRRYRVDLFHFGLTKDGQPKHPLYLPATAPLTRWE